MIVGGFLGLDLCPCSAPAGTGPPAACFHLGPPQMVPVAGSRALKCRGSSMGVGRCFIARPFLGTCLVFFLEVCRQEEHRHQMSCRVCQGPHQLPRAPSLHSVLLGAGHVAQPPQGPLAKVAVSVTLTPTSSSLEATPEHSHTEKSQTGLCQN